MEKFLRLMEEVYDVEGVISLTPESVIREIEGFSSLIGFSIIVTIADEYGKEITVQDFMNCKTIQDLYDKVVD